MNLDQNQAHHKAQCLLGFYQLGNELRPEPHYRFALLPFRFYQLGNELRPELVKLSKKFVVDFIS